MASVTSASACSSRGIHRLDRAEPIPGGEHLGFNHPKSLSRGGVLDGRGERAAVGLPGRGERRPVPGAGTGMTQVVLAGCRTPMVKRVGNGHVGDLASSSEPYSPLAAEHRSSQQPSLGVDAAAIPFLGGLRRKLTESAELVGEDPEFPVEQVGCEPATGAVGQPEPPGTARRDRESRACSWVAAWG